MNLSVSVSPTTAAAPRTMPARAPDPAPAAKPARQKYAVHGAAAEVENLVSWIEPHVRKFVGPFAVAGWPERFVPMHGTVRPYDAGEVMRHLSPAARALPATHDLAEVYQDGERLWVIDERWGMAEINFLKGQWRSWVLPRPQFDAVRCAEAAVLWPLAQLLRPRGLYLLPAAAAVRDGWALLILCPFGLEPELGALIRSGYKIIGQRWTAVREEDGRAALLHMPGMVERGSQTKSGARSRGWVDLNDVALGAWQNHAFCDAVVVAEPGRRARASLRPLGMGSAAALLRRAWPIAELHPSRRHSPLPTKLAQSCRCAELQLSRDPAELLPLLDSLRSGERGAPARAA